MDDGGAPGGPVVFREAGRKTLGTVAALPSGPLRRPFRHPYRGPRCCSPPRPPVRPVAVVASAAATGVLAGRTGHPWAFVVTAVLMPGAPAPAVRDRPGSGGRGDRVSPR
ncbi:hypothetical protein [Streptomyces cinerochromogenes]|uniref:hypothetical protein n=1 Tax=Streptomyces cinerochromogenes TaxID=66422 RepID=UPI0033BA778F